MTNAAAVANYSDRPDPAGTMRTGTLTGPLLVGVSRLRAPSKNNLPWPKSSPQQPGVDEAAQAGDIGGFGMKPRPLRLPLPSARDSG